jgi:hypothetical protein
MARNAVALVAAVLALALLPGHAHGDDRGLCTATVSSPAAAGRAVSSAAAGAVVCLGDGSYAELVLDGTSRGITVRAEHSGRATIAGADLAGSGLTLARFDVTDDVTIEPGSRKISVLHNRIRGGYFGVDAGPTTTTPITDTTIRGNLFVGPFGEDAIRLNRYHDSADRDPFGVLIEGNEITNVRENGNHSDCLQSVWGGDHLYFRRNYLHDNRCQGFFVKDQPEPVSRIVLEDNLMLRNAAPCGPPASSCGPPAIVQIVGPTRGIRVTGNTIWTPANDSPLTFRDGPFGAIALSDNVLYRGWSDWNGGFPHFGEARNLVCEWERTFPRLSPKSRRECSPRFLDPAHDDYRLGNGLGVDWAPAQQHFGY